MEDTKDTLETWKRILDYTGLVLKNTECTFINAKMIQRVAENNIKKLTIVQSNDTRGK